MDPEVPDEQFKKMEGDSHVQAAAAATPPAPPVRRRVTTAQVKKDLSDLESYIENEVLAWCGQLDTRLDKIEHEEEPQIKQALAYLQKQIERLEKTQNTDTPTSGGEIDRRLLAIEGATAALADAVRAIIADVQDLQPEPTEEIVFAKPPTTTPDQLSLVGDITAVATVCLTMNDVLMITRALANAKDLSDLQRVEILKIACRSAGVEITTGLQTRAGVFADGM